MEYWSKKTRTPVSKLLVFIKLKSSKYYDWKQRFGTKNNHNAKLPKSNWILENEKKLLYEFRKENPSEGYRRLTYMMMDKDITYISPATTYRLLKAEGLLETSNNKPSKKGTGFIQPTRPHEHWHTDISYVNICGTFYYFNSVIDGYSRALLYWDIRESMTEADVELIIQNAKDLYPHSKARIISDNGKQYVSKDFKEFIREVGLTHVRTSPYYPQSNGKIERFHGTLKEGVFRTRDFGSLKEAKEAVTEFIDYYNDVRLHSSLGYVTPTDKLNGNEQMIFDNRDAGLKRARAVRKEMALK